MPAPADLTGLVTPLHQEAHGTLWSLTFSLQPGTPPCYVVDVTCAGISKSRTMVCEEQLDQDEAIQELRLRALRWIVEYESRPHTGYTDWGTL